MQLAESLKVLQTVRRDEVVVTTMGTAREWMTLSEHPLDFNYVPSSMGQAPSLGLGIALGRPDQPVIVCNGDGSMLMNLGSLVTITAAAPKNLTLLVFVNGVYEVTGGQGTPGAAGSRSACREVDYAALARAAGFDSLYEFDDLEAWQESVQDVLADDGPTFAVLKVAPVPGGVGPKSPGPAKARAQKFADALRASFV